MDIHKEDIAKVNIRSEEVNEIMETIPSRLIRYGISVITIIILLVFTGTFYFRYPDTIQGSFIITSSNPPVTLKSKVDGNIEKLFYHNRDVVQKGDLIVVISSTANYEDILLLKSFFTRDSIIPYISALNLGEVQGTYINYGKALFEYQDFFKVDYYGSQIKIIEDQLEKRKQQIVYYSEAEDYNKELLNIEKDLYSRDSSVHKVGGVSLRDMQLAKAQIIKLASSCNTAQMNKSDAELTISQLSKELIELKMQRQQEHKKLHDELNAKLEALKNAINSWENSYCIYSAIDGVVSFKDIWQAHQNVVVGQSVVSVVPKEKDELLVRVSIPIQGAGKIKEGNWMNLIFSDYPEEEFGVVRCKLGSLSLLPDSTYTSVFPMCDTLKTNYNKVLVFKQNMRGDAVIITEDLSLFQRLINPLRSALTKYRVDEKAIALPTGR